MPQTTWYSLLGSMFKELLTPLGGVQVDDHYPLTLLGRPYLHDFLLLRRDAPTWSREQYRRLPDGICETTKNHILFAFYTKESGHRFRIGIQEIQATALFYRESYNLSEDAIDKVLLCAETPAPSSWEHTPPTGVNGVYNYHFPIRDFIKVISLNELQPTPQNAFLKTFAGSQAEKKRAFAAVRRAHFSLFTHKLYWLMAGLWAHWLEEGHDMSMPPALPDILQKGKLWQDSFLW